MRHIFDAVQGACSCRLAKFCMLYCCDVDMDAVCQIRVKPTLSLLVFGYRGPGNWLRASWSNLVVWTCNIKHIFTSLPKLDSRRIVDKAVMQDSAHG